MNGQVDWSELFFSAAGRAARSPSLIAAAILLALAVFYEAVAPSTLHWLTGWFVYPALFYCGACVLSKRLHDRGRSFEVLSKGLPQRQLRRAAGELQGESVADTPTTRRQAIPPFSPRRASSWQRRAAPLRG